MKRKIEQENWIRKDHYEHFKQMDDPFFGITTNVDCTGAYRKSKEEGISFFLSYLYYSLKAVNGVEEFKTRIMDNKVFLFDKVHAGPTVFREDKTYGHALILYDEDVDKFMREARKEIARVQAQKGLVYTEQLENVIHYTTLPWIRFTGIRQPVVFGGKDSVPKIAFGKLFREGGRMMMPVSIHGHHGLMDGWHVNRHLELFEGYLNG
ncbi:MAG: chloramphenicol acetyltransferase [Bacteroidales bacterium]|nr:chloramphenicol acetyltransferase [Bacteroidales bacterium]MCF8344099.1 chloramphenicol acetyltransferase [Bacteroidales bacterium]MCF8375772.1 chloramphenicol acetyltransferase [Bacteroidales bacterium]MCF8402238.1 chloramphenicol acetyltransferase [Bacteroidales bacterium]